MQAPGQIKFQVQGAGPFDAGKAEPPPAYPSDQAVVRSLDEARKRRGERALVQASAALQQVFNHPEETWVPLDDKAWRPAQSVAEKMLVEDAALLAEYRSQYEHEAAAELKEAADDPARLAAVMRRFFLTASGADAAERLAAIALDAGRPNLAAVYLERVLDCPAHKPLHSATLRVRLAVARKFAGDSLSWHAADRAAVPAAKQGMALDDAVVTFGGKPTRAAEILAQVEPPRAAASETLADWPLPTGNPSRTAQSSGGLPLLGAEQAALARPLTDNKRLAAQFERVAERNRHRGRATFFGAQPIIVGNVAFARTCRGVEAVDLRTGKPYWPAAYDGGEPIDKQEFAFDEWEEAGRSFNASATESFLLGNTLYGTLTSDGKRVYLVDELHLQPGSYNLFMTTRDKTDPARRTCNRLTALDAATGKPLWHLGGSDARKAGDPNGQLYFFGPPTPVAGKLYALAELQSEVGLWEIDPETGKPTWRQRLMLMHRRVDADPFRRSQACAVVVSEGIAICSTNTARLFAVDLLARLVLWERNFDGDLAQRSYLNFNIIDQVPPPENPHVADPPAVVGGHVVFQGPSLQGVHCLDLRSGQTNWRKDRATDQHVAGVQQGKVILVGSGRVRALDLDDGEEAWQAATPTPSGRGVFAGGRYLLPTERGDCLALDIETGKVAGTSFSVEAPPRPLGNLAARGDALVSLGRAGLQVFPLVELIRREAADALARNAQDARGQYLAGLIALHEQKLDEAAGKLLTSLRAGASFPERGQASRTLLRLASEEGLGNFGAMEALLGELRKAAKEPRDQAVVLRLEARAHLNAGRWREALVAAEDQAAIPGAGPVQTLADSSSRDPWLWGRAFALKVFQAAPADRRDALVRDVERRHAPAAGAGDVERLGHVATMYDGLAVGRRARLAIGRRELARRRLDLASLAYAGALKAAVSDDEKASALAGLAAVADAGRLPFDAYWYLERWKKEAPEGRDADGRTVAQAAAGFLKANGAAAPTTTEPKHWPVAPLRTELVPHSDRRGFSGRQWILPTGSDAPYFRRRAFAFKRGEAAFTSVNLATGRVDHDATLGEESLRAAAAGGARDAAPVLGYVYFAGLDDRVAAVSVLDRGASLWCSAPGSPESAKDELDLAAEWAYPEGRQQSDGVRVGPVGTDFVVVRTPKELFALDPATGKPRWRRSDLGSSHKVFGDEERLYLVSPKGDFTAIRPGDGEKVGEGRWPWFKDLDPDANCRGRLVLRSPVAAGKELELRLWDPVADKDVWTRRFASGSRRWVHSATEPVAVAAPDGRVEVFHEATGETLAAFTLPRPLPRHLVVRAFRIGSAVFAAVEEGGGRLLFRGSTTGVASQTVHGRLLALPAGGTKPLWEAPLRDARVLTWPLDHLPVLVVLESPQARRDGEAMTTKFRVFEKATGRVLTEAALPSEMQGITDVAIEGRRSRLEFSGWTKKLRLYFGEEAKPAARGKEEATLEDVGKLFGGLLGRVGQPPTAPPKK